MTRDTKTILFVEDEQSLRSVLRDKFSREGFNVLEAKNGKEELEISMREHPDLILLDIIMSVMDGIAMLKKLRQDAWGKIAKVIMLTNLSDNEKLSETITQGSYEYLVKSDCKIENVVAKVRELLETPTAGKKGSGAHPLF